jgi:2-dehydropantoate 2-reductase
MRIAIVGAGAIGGWLGAALSLQGHEVSALARGDTLAALRRDGWRLRNGPSFVQRPAIASDKAADLGFQDIVFICVKSTSLRSVSAAVAAMCTPDTIIVPVMNGIPWWFLNTIAGHAGAEPLAAIDEGGALSRLLPLEQIIGCVVYAAASTPEPGLSSLNVNGRWIIGEPQGGHSNRLAKLHGILHDAGIPVVSSGSIHTEVWNKLISNMTFNPLSALTRATTDRIAGNLLLRGLIAGLMSDAAAIGAALGLHIEENVDTRLQNTLKMGPFKTSMLQDLEAGRPLEIATLLAAPLEIARRVAVPAPAIETLLGLIGLLDQTRPRAAETGCG